jgi:hypothetical protein
MIRFIETNDRRISAQYNIDGAIFTVCKPVRPRKSERTWIATRGSIANLGAQAVNLRNVGLPKAKG